MRKLSVGWAGLRSVVQQKQRDNTIHSELDSFTVAVAVAVIRGFERGLFHTLLLIYAVVVSLV